MRLGVKVYYPLFARTHVYSFQFARKINFSREILHLYMRANSKSIAGRFSCRSVLNLEIPKVSYDGAVPPKQNMTLL